LVYLGGAAAQVGPIRVQPPFLKPVIEILVAVEGIPQYQSLVLKICLLQGKIYSDPDATSLSPKSWCLAKPTVPLQLADEK
jgi:hypothetical protein